MNIIFFDLAGPGYPGGCEKYFANLAHYFSKNNKVIFVSSSSYMHFMENVYAVLFRKAINKVQFLKRDLGFGKTLDISLQAGIPFSSENKKILKVLREADFIYTKNEFQELAFLYFYLGKKEYRKKVIVGVHSAIFIPQEMKGLWKTIHDIQYKSIFYKKFLINAKYIHVPNKDYINLIAGAYGVNENKICYIPYPIDWKTELLQRKAGNFTILWAGRLTQQKGLDRLFRILSLFATKNPDEFSNIKFLIAGQAAGQENIVNKLTSTYPNITHSGFNTHMIDLYKVTDLAIVTSYFETFGYNVLEPLSFGIPVVSFNIPGPSSIILDEKVGRLVTREEEFITAIIAFYQHWKRGKDYNATKKHAYTYINREFSKEKIYKELEALFLKENSIKYGITKQ